MASTLPARAFVGAKRRVPVLSVIELIITGNRANLFSLNPTVCSCNSTIDVQTLARSIREGGAQRTPLTARFAVQAMAGQ